MSRHLIIRSAEGCVVEHIVAEVLRWAFLKSRSCCTQKALGAVHNFHDGALAGATHISRLRHGASMASD